VNPHLNRKFPSALDIERAALKRIPKFARDYVRYGMGQGGSVKRNRDTLDAVKLIPRYLVDADEVDYSTELFGQRYAAPFGVAPIGMGGLAWPHSADYIAAAARNHSIPFCASTFSITSLETIREQAREYSWFQLYRPSIETVENDLLSRIEQAGYDVLVVTMDVPSPMRRDHDIRNGFTVPPALDLQTLWQIATHPAWSMAMARCGFPEFENLVQYVPDNLKKREALHFMSNLVVGHITPEIIATLRERWKGKLVLKGILSADEARQCRDLGVDGIIVSNHGGRQLEAAPSPCEVLGQIRDAVGAQFTLIADGGVRTGLDICRMLSLGADFIMMGRPFYYAVAAMGAEGADHIMKLFKAELQCTMGQLGCPALSDIRERRMAGAKIS
jgi:L-lactate dehydrogenase (cytochrome)